VQDLTGTIYAIGPKAAEKGKLTRGQHRNVCQSIFEHVSWR
jgi:hypothetical protein